MGCVLRDASFSFIPALLHTNLMHMRSLLAWVVLIRYALQVVYVFSMWLATLNSPTPLMPISFDINRTGCVEHVMYCGFPVMAGCSSWPLDGIRSSSGRDAAHRVDGGYVCMYSNLHWCLEPKYINISCYFIFPEVPWLWGDTGGKMGIKVISIYVHFLWNNTKI